MLKESLVWMFGNMAFKRNTLGTKTLFLVCTLAMLFSVSCLAQNKDGQLDQMTKEAWKNAVFRTHPLNGLGHTKNIPGGVKTA